MSGDEKYKASVATVYARLREIGVPELESLEAGAQDLLGLIIGGFAAGQGILYVHPIAPGSEVKVIDLVIDNIAQMRLIV